MLEEDCVDLKGSIKGTIKDMRKKKAGGEAQSKTPTTASTPSQSRSASPTKSALRNASQTLSVTGSQKRKVAFSLSDVSASSEDDVPETPSKRPRTTRRTAFAAARTLPVRRAESASSEETEEDTEMPDAPPRLVASGPVAGPSTPRRPKATTNATPTSHAYRTPPSARMRPLAVFSDDDGEVEEDEMARAEADAEVGEEDDALPVSRRFRPVFLDRVQWARRAPRMAHDRAAAERRTRELVERWGHPFEALRLAAVAEAAAG